MSSGPPLFVAGKPRYWIADYDVRHFYLLLPLTGILLVVLFLLSREPKPGTAPGAKLPPTGPAASSAAPMAPTVLQSPYAAAVMMQERLGTVEGTAEPLSLVRLYLGKKLLGESAADPQGRFRFQLTNFPAGQHRMRAEAWSGGRSVTSEEVLFTVVAEPKRGAGAAPKRFRPAPVKK
jgi:hypothetical protein